MFIFETFSGMWDGPQTNLDLMELKWPNLLFYFVFYDRNGPTFKETKSVAFKGVVSPGDQPWHLASFMGVRTSTLHRSSTLCSL